MKVFFNFFIIVIICANLDILACQEINHTISQSDLETCQKSKAFTKYKYTEFFLINKKNNKIASDESLHLKFYLFSKSNIYFLLSTNLNPDKWDRVYEIRISNDFNRIYMHLATSQEYTNKSTPNILSEDGVKLIEVLLKKDGIIQVFVSTHSIEPVLEYHDPHPLDINYVSFRGKDEFFHSCKFDGFGSDFIANCSASGYCSCYKDNIDYESNKSICVAACEGTCLNGYCKRPGQCECYAGFVLSESNENECVPICIEGCPNGFCYRPGKCACNNGYYMTMDNICKPVCEGGCYHGNCTAPGHCESYQGFAPSEAIQMNMIPYSSMIIQIIVVKVLQGLIGICDR